MLAVDAGTARVTAASVSRRAGTSRTSRTGAATGVCWRSSRPFPRVEARQSVSIARVRASAVDVRGVKREPRV